MSLNSMQQNSSDIFNMWQEYKKLEEAVTRSREIFEELYLNNDNEAFYVASGTALTEDPKIQVDDHIGTSEPLSKLFDLSHRMRSSLFLVQGWPQILLEKSDLDEDVREALKIIEKHSTLLKNCVEEMEGLAESIS